MRAFSVNVRVSPLTVSCQMTARAKIDNFREVDSIRIDRKKTKFHFAVCEFMHVIGSNSFVKHFLTAE